jgi:hypothetical protein
MTEHEEFCEKASDGSADFTTLTNAAAIARIRQLAAQGLPDATLAEMFGWNRTDIRRAIAPAPARQP